MRWLSQQIWTWLNKRLPSEVHTDPEYRKAHEFKNRFKPQKGSDYKWVSLYAREIYSRLDQVDQTLDAKAESIIKIIGGGSGLITLGAIVNLQKIGAIVAVFLVFALIFALVAIFIAAWVRAPRQAFLPPSIGWAIEYADSYREEAESKFLAQWHLASEGMRLSVRSKAKGVKIATYWAGAALVAVALSFVAATAIMIVDSNGNPGGPTVPNESQEPTPLAPDPSGVPQTPDPAQQAEPMQIEKGGPAGQAEPQVTNRSEPAKQAEPQSIRFSHGSSTDE